MRPSNLLKSRCTAQKIPSTSESLAASRSRLGAPKSIVENTAPQNPRPAPAAGPVTYQPIGTFVSKVVHPYEAPRQAAADSSELESIVRLNDDAQLKLALRDLEGFTKIWLVYDFHHNKDWKPLVLPPRGSHDKRGVFATRSPYRPNSIGLSAVELARIENRDLIVRATDLLDGTPILDIKPYVPYADSFPGEKTGWLEGIESERCEVTFNENAEAKLKWLEANGAATLRGFLRAQLEHNPTDHVRKRVTKTEPQKSNDVTTETYRLAYRTWRADFQVAKNLVTITDIGTGYSMNDLDEAAPGFQDKYADKRLHRDFLSQFQQSDLKGGS